MHHRHAVFHGDRLPPALLNVDVASGETGKNQCLLAMDKVTAVELGRDRHSQAQPPHRGLDDWLIRYRGDKIAAQADEHLRVPIDHRLYGIDDGMAVCARRLESEYPFELIEQRGLWLLIDADGPVTL